MNKKLQLKDEKKNMYRRSFDDKFPGVLDLLKDEKGVNLMKWGDKMDYFEFKSPNDLQKGMAWFQSELAQSRKEWQEEQNKVVNSGRKLYQEGQKAEREKIIGEAEKMKLRRLNTPRSFGDRDIVNQAPGYNQALDDILHILKGEK